MKKAVFLDRDGVIVIPHFRDGRSFAVRSMDDFQLYPDAHASLSLLKKAGFLLIVVTNQPDMGKGLIPPDIMAEMNNFLFQHLPLESIMVCPHVKEEGCSCRKPKSGLLKEAAEAFNIDCAASYMIGDRRSDVEAGKSIGCKTVFIDLGYASEKKPKDANFSCQTLSEAAAWIVHNNEKMDQ